MDLQTLYQELIIDHGTEPRNFAKLEKASHFAEGYNPLCGDKIQLFLKVENDKIIAASFQGSGCAISTASASLMTETLIGKSLQEAYELFDNLQALITVDTSNSTASTPSTPSTPTNTSKIPKSELLEKMGKLSALSGVQAFPARVKCATLPWHALLSALKGT